MYDHTIEYSTPRGMVTLSLVIRDGVISIRHAGKEIGIATPAKDGYVVASQKEGEDYPRTYMAAGRVRAATLAWDAWAGLPHQETSL